MAKRTDMEKEWTWERKRGKVLVFKFQWPGNLPHDGVCRKDVMADIFSL